MTDREAPYPPTDERIEAAVARLTPNEKECLRRRLLPQTAKEMAIDLGISSHAVEKRLKMARAKLGTSSSLTAARQWAQTEEYHRLGPQISALPGATAGTQDDADASPDGAVKRRLPMKGSMMIATLCLIALAVQDAPSPLPATATRKVGMDEAAAFIRPGFRQKDIDGSGYLDPREVSAMEPRDASRDKRLPPAPAVGERDAAAERKWMGKMDTDRDGRVSEDEYVAYLMPWILYQGVPADWQPPHPEGDHR